MCGFCSQVPDTPVLVVQSIDLMRLQGQNSWTGNYCQYQVQRLYCTSESGLRYQSVASYPGLLTPAFVTCSTNVGEGLVKLIVCCDILDIGWTCGGVAYSQKTASMYISQCSTDHNYRPQMTEWSTSDSLVMFLGFRKSTHSCTEGICHSSIRLPNIQVHHCT